jgi:iron complex transport system substrate-binding protein
MKTAQAPKARLPNFSNVQRPYIGLLPPVVATVFVCLSTILLILAANMPHARAATPTHIVSLSLASDEILLDMLASCGGFSRVAGLSIFADDPSASSVVIAAKSVKGRVHSEPESLFALKPDLVIAASFNRPELIKMIRARKIPLLMLESFASARDISDHIQKIGDAVGCPKEAKGIRTRFEADVTPATARDKPVRIVNYSPDMALMGKDTLFDDLVTRAGGVNAASMAGLSHWPRIDTETLLKLSPDKIVVLGDDTPERRKEIMSHAAWGRLDAVKKNQFIFLESKTALSTSHYFARAVATLRQRLSDKP